MNLWEEPDVRQPILIFLAMTAAGPAFADLPQPLTETSHQVLDVRGLRSLQVDNARGLIRVRESRDGRLHLTAYRICRGKDAAQARAYAAETGVKSVREGAQHVVVVSYPNRTRVEIDWWELLKGGDISELSKPLAEVRLVIEVPRDIQLDLRSSSGEIDVQGRFAPLVARSSSGDVQFRGGDARIQTSSGDVSVLAARRVSVTTASGDCEADSLAGPFSFQSSSGDLVLGSASDSVRVRTQSGDVAIRSALRGLDGESSSGEFQVASAGGRVRVTTASGTLQLRAIAPFSTLDATTSSGDLTLRLAPGTGARLDVTTSSGDIECNIPITLEQSDRRRITGRIGSGGPPIRLSSASGGIVVMTGGR